MKFVSAIVLAIALASQVQALNVARTLRASDAAAAVARANPIRKVVTLLQGLQKKVEEEAEKEEELYEKYMCYCKSAGGGLKDSIAASDTKIPEVESMIKEHEAQKSQLDEDLKQHKADREAANMAMEEATSIREKEAAAFAKEKSETDTNAQALVAAVEAIEKGMGSAFLQSGSAQSLRKIVVQSNLDMSDVDRQTLAAFLQGSQNQAYAPASGEIVGILKEIGDEMAKGLLEASAAEKDATANYENLMSAKTKEVEALTKAIEEKSVRVGELAVSIAKTKNDLSDTQAALLDDKKFLEDLEKNCGTKEAEWAEITKTRNEELIALADTIKILQDDDALELFKKTLPSASSASFMQMQTNMANMRSRALEIVRSARNGADVTGRQHLDFIALALQGKRKGFEMVLKMIDDMVVILKKEQSDDDTKKAYCDKELDASEDKKKVLEQSKADTETAIEDTEEEISTLTDEIKALEEGIATLDKSVADAQEQRQKENQDYQDLMAENTAAKELIGVAKNRLNKFYNPKLYVPPPKEEVSFTQISMRRQASDTNDAPPPPPESFSAYKSKGEETTGVIAMLDLLVKDLDKEMTQAEADEKNAQADYEQMTADAAEKRGADVTSIGAKQGSKAELEGALQMHKDEHAATSKEIEGVSKYISSLHSECDWLLQYFEARKQARTSEMEALANAKSVLSGADFSMLTQVASRRQLRAGYH